MHGNSRVKISRSFDFDAARYNGVFRGIFGEGGGRGGKGLVLEGPGFNKIRDMHRSPLRTYIYMHTRSHVYTQIQAMEWNRGRYQYARCATGRS